MFQQGRVLFSDDGTISDLSVELTNFREGSQVVDYTTAEDYIYLASFLPFNHRHFDLSVVNDQAAVPTIEYWDGSTWRTAVDVLDRTSLSGVSLAQDGIISWNTDPDYGWQREYKSTDITGLTGTKIYDMYWARFSWDATLKATMALDYIGLKFSKDGDLYDLYPDLNNSSLKTAFESGKTDWEEQHYIAVQRIVRDLKRRRIILSQDQIFDFDLLRDSACHAAAMVIYWGLGEFDMHDKAAQKYKDVMDLVYFNVDSDADGRLEPAEKIETQGWLSR